MTKINIPEVVAEVTEARAREADKGGKVQTAIQNYFHANNYWRMADVFLQGFDPRRALSRNPRDRRGQGVWGGGPLGHAPRRRFVGPHPP